MKKILILLFALSLSKSQAQEISEQEIKTDVKEVKVFINNAQITRLKTLDIKPGTTLLKFVNLSPFIDPKSIQVKAKGDITLLSVNHQQNFLEKSEKSKETATLQTKIKEITDKINIETIYRNIIQEQLAFLKENREIGGKNQELNLENLKNTAIYYNTQLKSLNMEDIEHSKTIEELTRQKNELENQINTISGKKEFPTGEILVKVNASGNAQAQFELTYVTSNAGWFPSYDIKAISINDPIKLTYKANIHQDTKEDWKNIKISLSSSDPNISGVAPELKTYLLNYYTSAPVYNNQSNNISGRITDNETNEPLIGVNVTVDGTSIGTTTDINGYYSITIPNYAKNMAFSYIGYSRKILPITGPSLNVSLSPDMVCLNEVVITGYGSKKEERLISEALSGKISGLDLKDNKNKNNMVLPIEQTNRQTTMEFEIKTLYTIMSDNKILTINMEMYDLPAIYKYFSVPKINRDAFLIAYIADWEKYNLMDGEANIYFEDTYIGKTLLDLTSATDTLNISLGRDKNVNINRLKIKDFSSKQFIGSKKEESRNWITNVKNNKKQQINIIVLDQVPVSTMEEIEVDVKKYTGAKWNKENGEIKWEFTLEPGDKKDLELLYSVKYPKSRNLTIE